MYEVKPGRALASDNQLIQKVSILLYCLLPFVKFNHTAKLKALLKKEKMTKGSNSFSQYFEITKLKYGA